MKTSNLYLVMFLSTLMIFSCKSKEEVGLSPKDQGEVLIEQYCSGSRILSLIRNTFRASANWRKFRSNDS